MLTHMFDQFTDEMISNVILSHQEAFNPHIPHASIVDTLRQIMHQKESQKFHKILHQLPPIESSKQRQTTEHISIEFTPKSTTNIAPTLKQLKPWRKGPFKLNHCVINAEWQSHLKWDRMKEAITVTNKHVLDVGCGNGYYLFRCLEQSPKFVLGIDPTLLYFYQYLCIQHFLSDQRVKMLPIGWQKCSWFRPIFDVVLCMGVLYHQQNPMTLLKSLKKCLRDDGTLLLETLIYDSKDPVCLCPKSRYANMRNVYFIPSELTVIHWLTQCGFSSIHCINHSVTTMNEQRVTDWSGEMSLIDSLDDKDISRTIEGYHAPLRAIFCAKK